MNQLGPWERIVIYKQLIEDIRAHCDNPIINILIGNAEADVNKLVKPKCFLCHDTGYEDVRGQRRCRNNCPSR